MLASASSRLFLNEKSNQILVLLEKVLNLSKYKFMEDVQGSYCIIRFLRQFFWNPICFKLKYIRNCFGIEFCSNERTAENLEEIYLDDFVKFTTDYRIAKKF